MTTSQQKKFVSMKKALPIFLLTAAALFLVTSNLQAEEKLPELKRILFLGDSITHAGHYVDIVETQMRLQKFRPFKEDCPYEIINIGLSSETCSGLSEPDHPFPRPDVHERLDRALEKIKPNLVFACYGMNDGIYYPFSKERFQAYKDGINKLIKKVHASGAELILITPPPFDALPLRSKKGALLPAGAEKYSYFANYENYDNVLKRYSQWIMQQKDRVKRVVDIRNPILAYLAEKRKKEPQFTMAKDGVHPNDEGHFAIATAILKGLEIESFIEPSAELKKLMRQRGKILHDAWLTEVGHKRPNTGKGLPLPEALKKVEAIEKKTVPLIKKEQQSTFSKRASTGGTVYQIHYPAVAQEEELKINVDYFLWVPEGVKTIRGVILHQHGCGAGSAIGGRTAADDLHWQALAKKWDCALMGTSYEARKGASCRLWCDPRNGSDQRFNQALRRFATETDHLEIELAPWCFWGHSGGGFWASLMQTKYPNRIVAIWLQSGTAYGYWMKGDIESPKFSRGTYDVPVMGNPGLKEKGHKRFQRAWNGTVAMRKAYLEKGAPFFEFAPDPKTAHECGDSRYLSIPFFDFWLAHRLPSPERCLEQMNEGSFPTLKQTNSAITDWKQTMKPKLDEFIKTGTIHDTTPPPAPQNISAKRLEDGTIEITWNAEADFESGIRAFIIERAGKKIAQVPEAPKNHYGKPLFQSMTYGDTPAGKFSMKYIDKTAPQGKLKQYKVRSVNSVKLISP